MINGWNRAIQLSDYSMFNALPKPHVNCKNQRVWILTLWICSAWFRAFQVQFVWNRWSIMLRKVIGIGLSAQQCLDDDEFSNCHWWAMLQQLDSARFLPPILFNSSSKSPADNEQCKMQHKEWRILMNNWKKVWVKIERIWEKWWIFEFALKCDCWFWVFCYD